MRGFLYLMGAMLGCAVGMSCLHAQGTNASTLPFGAPSAAPSSLLPDADKTFSPSAGLFHSTPSPKSKAPDIRCPNIDYRNWRTWSDATRALSTAPKVSLFQNWVEKPDKLVKPATVIVAHSKNDLIVYAEMADDDIYNIVQQDNVPAYQSGDVFVIYLKPEKEQAYFEQQFTPEGYGWQVRWPDAAANKAVAAGQRPDGLAVFAGDTSIVKSRALSQPDKKMWRVLAIIPLDKITGNGEVPTVWHFSFGRLDWSRNATSAVLTSTSALGGPDFHEQGAWGKLTLVP